MLMMRERPRSAIALPLPAPLPSLPDALARRAGAFGPFDGDDMPPAPAGLSRRAGLVGAVAALGALALTALPKAARAAATAMDDARLVAWCDELPGIDAALSDLFARAPDVEADARIDVLSTHWSAATAGIERTAARGPAGIAAKARAVRHLAAQGDTEVATPIAASLAADVLRLGVVT